MCMYVCMYFSVLCFGISNIGYSSFFSFFIIHGNHNSWEPWKSMRATDQLHTYLRNNNMLHVIPKEFRNMTPNTREEP